MNIQKSLINQGKVLIEKLCGVEERGVFLSCPKTASKLCQLCFTYPNTMILSFKEKALCFPDNWEPLYSFLLRFPGYLDSMILIPCHWCVP